MSIWRSHSRTACIVWTSSFVFISYEVQIAIWQLTINISERCAISHWTASFMFLWFIQIVDSQSVTLHSSYQLFGWYFWEKKVSRDILNLLVETNNTTWQIAIGEKMPLLSMFTISLSAPLYIVLPHINHNLTAAILEKSVQLEHIKCQMFHVTFAYKIVLTSTYNRLHRQCVVYIMPIKHFV